MLRGFAQSFSVLEAGVIKKGETMRTGIVSIWAIFAAIWMSVLAAPTRCAADMIGTSFKQKAASGGMSKVLIKRTLHKGDADASAIGFDLDPCNVAPSEHWVLDIEINSSAGTIDKAIDVLSPAWDLTQCFMGIVDKATLDTGDCQIQYKSVLTTDPPASGKLTVKCLLAGAVGTIQNVVVTVHNGVFPLHKICFFNGAGGYLSPATVKKDGSDGKSIKMLNAPLSACEDNGF